MGEERFYFNPGKRSLIFFSSNLLFNFRFISMLRGKDKGPHSTLDVGLADDTNCPFGSLKAKRLFSLQTEF